MADMITIANDLYTANNYSIRLAEKRDLMSKRWEEILEKFGGTNIKMVNEV
ncbi:hypothetical protein J5751_01935 [bacterium]|nr:hypothetical protein [bacterium]